MNFFYIDSSALVKRYHKEKGTDLVDALLDFLLAKKPTHLITSMWAIPETIATLNRKKNEGKIEATQLIDILANLLTEIDIFDTITVDEERILGSIPYITMHNLNSSDALHLSAIKEAGEIAKYVEGTIIVITSDKRLLKASEDEGFKALNPEEVEMNIINELLGS